MRGILASWPLGLLPLIVAVVLSARFGSIVDLQITEALQDLGELESALGLYKARHGDFPSETSGLAALTGQGGPLVYVPKDPWGNAYLYRHAAGTSSYLVYSAGLNHSDDGGLDDDVIPGPKTYPCADYGVNCPPPALGAFAWIALGLGVLSLGVGIARAFPALIGLMRPADKRSSGP
jgi:general secretion pathway protein G